ncbi:MAG: hypothetical protein H6Q74_1357 [Firmicutes bacterium]|nr:hypothetical protein [Bacillota bacterium]
MKEKIIVAIFALMLLINGGVPAVSHASGNYSEWCTEADAYIGTVGQTISIPKSVVYYLLDQGYSLGDVITAGYLAENTEPVKPAAVLESEKNDQINQAVGDITKVLEMKKNTNKWDDVAKTLNIAPENFKQDIEKTKQLLSKEPRFL